MSKQEPGYQDIELQEVSVNTVDENESHQHFNLNLISDIEVLLDVKLGDANLTVEELHGLRVGQAFKLNQGINEPVQLILNNKVVGLGKLVVVDGCFGVELLEINSN